MVVVTQGHLEPPEIGTFVGCRGGLRRAEGIVGVSGVCGAVWCSAGQYGGVAECGAVGAVWCLFVENGVSVM